MRSLREAQQKISNIDNHIILAPNILRQALAQGDAGVIKMGTGFMEFAESAKIFDMRASTGQSFDHAKIFCRDPSDILNKTVISIQDKRIQGPWSSWLVIRS